MSEPLTPTRPAMSPNGIRQTGAFKQEIINNSNTVPDENITTTHLNEV